CRCPGKTCGLRIVGCGLPDRTATVPPALLAVLPGLVAGLAGAGDGVGAPEALAGVQVGALDEAADAVFAASGTDDRHIAHDQRGERDCFSDAGIGDLALPH